MATGKLVVLVLAVVLVFGGAYWLISAGPASLSHEKALVLAAQKTADLNYLTSDFQFVVDGQMGDESLAIELSGQTKADNQNQSASGEVSLSGNFQQADTGMNFSFVGEFILAENKLFAKLGTLPEIITLFIPIQIPEEIFGEWILVFEDVNQEMEEDPDSLTFDQIEEIMTEITSKLLERDMFSVTDKTRDQGLDRYTIQIHPAGIMEFIQYDLVPLMEDVIGEEIPMIDNFEVEEATDQMQEVLEQLQMQIWSDGRYIHRFRIDTNLEMEEDMLLEGAEATLSIEVNYRDFNQPVLIEAPVDYLQLEELEELFPSSFDSDSLFFSPEPDPGFDYPFEL